MNLSELSSCNLIGLASSLSILLAQNLSSEEISILSGFFSALGDNLAIISSSPISNPNTNSPSSKNTNSNSNC